MTCSSLYQSIANAQPSGRTVTILRTFWRESVQPIRGDWCWEFGFSCPYRNKPGAIGVERARACSRSCPKHFYLIATSVCGDLADKGNAHGSGVAIELRRG